MAGSAATNAQVAAMSKHHWHGEAFAGTGSCPGPSRPAGQPRGLDTPQSLSAPYRRPGWRPGV